MLSSKEVKILGAVMKDGLYAWHQDKSKGIINVKFGLRYGVNEEGSSFIDVTYPVLKNHETGGTLLYFKDYGKTWALTKEELMFEEKPENKEIRALELLRQRIICAKGENEFNELYKHYYDTIKKGLKTLEIIKKECDINVLISLVTLNNRDDEDIRLMEEVLLDDK